MSIHSTNDRVEAPALAANDDAPKLNKRQLAKAATRAKVIAAAQNLFFSVGFEAATIRDIAEDAGMSTGAVFANFKDKADLYRAVYGHDPLTPEQGLRLAQALREAEAFISGFEDDEMQDGVDAILAQTRGALSMVGMVPVVEPALLDDDGLRVAA
ncbi:TetR/AcrR family transcriptional regulator [Brevundimonas diminuta]